MSKTLLIVYHAPSPNTVRIKDTLINGAVSASGTLIVKAIPALKCSPEDVLAADSIILFTPENLGYLSGGMKDFFDRIYYPCLEEKQGLPIAAVIRAGHDGTGSHRALKTILTGLKWRWVQPALICRGAWDDKFLEDCNELAQAMAAGLEMGII
jgi:multimeric flavodoxin WrbA